MDDLLLIGEAAQALGVTPKTLRFYEHKGILAPPPRSPAGYRLYSHEDLERVRFVLRAKGMGLVLDDAQEVLAAAEAACCGEAAPALTEKLRAKLAQVEARMRDLEALKNKLTEALDAVGASGQAESTADCDGELCLPQVLAGRSTRCSC